MSEPPNPESRPSRLSLPARILVIGLLAASFISGALVWWGQTLQAGSNSAPPWLHACLVLHGSLNPFLCATFGYLVCQHIRLGWQLKANLITGFAMEFVFAGLILSGVGLYYAGSPAWRDGLTWSHRALGLLVPLSLGAHGIAAARWVRTSVPPAGAGADQRER